MPLESAGGQSVYYHLQETSKFEFGLWALGKRKKTELNKPDRNLLAFGRSLHSWLRTYTWPFPAVQFVQPTWTQLNLPEVFPVTVPSSWQGSPLAAPLGRMPVGHTAGVELVSIGKCLLCHPAFGTTEARAQIHWVRMSHFEMLFIFSAQVTGFCLRNVQKFIPCKALGQEFRWTSVIMTGDLSIWFSIS